MGFNSRGDHFVINVENSDKVVQEMKGMTDCHNEIYSFIIDSAKQMAAFLQNEHSCGNESRILRTPSRRTSKRKRSSMAPSLMSTSKKSQTSSLKIRDVSAATPRRFSKRTKRSTIKLDTTFDQQIDTKEEPNSVTINANISIVNHEVIEVTTKETISCHNGVEDMDLEVEDKEAIDGTNKDINRDIDANDVFIIDNKVVTASELMSELSIKEIESKEVEENKIEYKLNESENEWMTDDEEQSSPKNETEQFFDAINESKAKDKKNKSNSNNSFANKTITSSAAKEKRKKSLYFTPQTTQRSTRAQTRMLSRIADSSQKTPQTTGMSSRIRKDSNLTNSAETNGSLRTGTSSNRSVRSYSRIQKKGPSETKALTDSALKRRQEAEEQRRIKLLASVEKENRAKEKRRILLEQKVNEKKLKSQEKAIKAAEMRERQKQLETERLKKELEKREEWDRKLEEHRKEQMRKRQEEMALKAVEIERRKQMKELHEIETKMKKLEEFERKQEQERERLREQERMAAIIQQHNNSLQQKAVANSFIKKYESNTQLMSAKVMVTKITASETAQHLNSTYNKTTEPKIVEGVSPGGGAPPVKAKNSTFVVKDDSKEIMSYDMTPPPKEHDYDNYDISEIQSDDDTDDEQQPRKRIPMWARGQQFYKQVHKQYGKSQKHVFREVKHIFGTGEQLLNRFQVEFDLMFPKKTALHPKYAKRTSSAVWDEPPSRYRFDDSSINQSFL